MGRKKQRQKKTLLTTDAPFQYPPVFLSFLESSGIPHSNTEGRLNWMYQQMKTLRHPLADHNSLAGDNCFVFNMGAFWHSESNTHQMLGEKNLDFYRNNPYLISETPVQYYMRCELLAEQVVQQLREQKTVSLMEASLYLLNLIQHKAGLFNIQIILHKGSNSFHPDSARRLTKKHTLGKTSPITTQHVAVIRPQSTEEVKLLKAEAASISAKKIKEAQESKRKRIAKAGNPEAPLKKLPEVALLSINQQAEREAKNRLEDIAAHYHTLVTHELDQGVLGQSLIDSIRGRIVIDFNPSRGELTIAWHIPVSWRKASFEQALNNQLLEKIALKILSDSQWGSTIRSVVFAGDFNADIPPSLRENDGESLRATAYHSPTIARRIDAAISIERAAAASDDPQEALSLASITVVDLALTIGQEADNKRIPERSKGDTITYPIRSLPPNPDGTKRKYRRICLIPDIEKYESGSIGKPEMSFFADNFFTDKLGEHEWSLLNFMVNLDSNIGVAITAGPYEALVTEWEWGTTSKGKKWPQPKRTVTITTTDFTFTVNVQCVDNQYRLTLIASNTVAPNAQSRANTSIFSLDTKNNQAEHPPEVLPHQQEIR